MLAIPGLLFAIAVVTFLGRGVVQIAIAIAILNIPIFARLLRGSLLSLREADYVLAARSVGVPAQDLLYRHMQRYTLPLLADERLELNRRELDRVIAERAGLPAPEEMAE